MRYDNGCVDGGGRREEGGSSLTYTPETNPRDDATDGLFGRAGSGPKNQGTILSLGYTAKSAL